MFSGLFRYQPLGRRRRLRRLETHYINLRRLHRLYLLAPDNEQKQLILTHRQRLLAKYYDQFVYRPGTFNVYGLWRDKHPQALDEVLGIPEASKSKLPPIVQEFEQFAALVEPENEETWVESNETIWDEIKAAVIDAGQPLPPQTRGHRKQFIALVKGLEVNFRNPHGCSFERQHLATLTTLLHLSILRRRWNEAYMIFAVLVRMPKIDIRLIWPMGIEILHQLNRNEDVDRLFKWLEGFLGVSPHIHSLVGHAGKDQGPLMIWRLGTKTSSPMYVSAMVWRLIIQEKFGQALDKLDELMVQAPYNQDGAFYCMRALARIGECVDIEDLNVFGMKMADIRRDLEEAERYNYMIPKEFFEEQLAKLNQTNCELVERVWGMLDKKGEEFEVDVNGQDSEHGDSGNGGDESEGWGNVKDDESDDGDDGWGDIKDDESEAGDRDGGWGDIKDDESEAGDGGCGDTKRGDDNGENEAWGHVKDDGSESEIKPKAEAAVTWTLSDPIESDDGLVPDNLNPGFEFEVDFDE